MFASRTAWKLSPNRLAIALERLKQSGKEVFDLAASNPTTVGLQYDEPSIFQALTQPEVLRYSPDPKGRLSARQAVTHYYVSRGDRPPNPDDMILTASTSEGYAFIFRLLCEPGDEVLSPAPSYPLFEYLASLNDVRTVPYQLFYDHGWHLDLRSIEDSITPRTRAIIVVHPNNPTGSYVADSARDALNELCSRRRIALLVDEVFLDYQLAEAPRRSLVGNHEALTFTLSGLSKICALPQMKLAWIVASGPKEAVHASMERLEIIADTFLSVSAPIQAAAPVLLAGRNAIQDQLCHRLRHNLSELDAQLARQKACTRLDVEGGWSVVLRVPATGSDEEMALSLMEQHSVLVHPGHFFDFPQEGHLVLSLIVPPEEFAEGVRRMLAHCAVT